MTEYEKRHVVAKSVEEAEKLIKEFEVETLSKFTIFRRNKGFSKDLDCKFKLVCLGSLFMNKHHVSKRAYIDIFSTFFLFNMNQVLLKLIILLLIILKLNYQM